MHMQKQGCPYYSPGFFPSPSLSASCPLPQGSSPTSWSRSSRSGCASPTAASWQRAWWDTCARTRPAGDSWGRSRRPLHSRRKLRCLRTPELREGSTPDGLFSPQRRMGALFSPSEPPPAPDCFCPVAFCQLGASWVFLRSNILQGIAPPCGWRSKALLPRWKVTTQRDEAK